MPPAAVFLPEAEWSSAFPEADPFYTYEAFLKGVAYFPAFCNETNLDGWTVEQTCRRELATFFAQVTQETGERAGSVDDFWTQGLFHIEEENKGEYKATAWGNDVKWPPQADPVRYYGRGPLQLSWNYNYGMFSSVYYANDQGYNAKMELLNHPENVSNDAVTAFSAAFWFYMTP